MCALALAGCGRTPAESSGAPDHAASAHASDGEASRAVTRALARQLLDTRENVTRATTDAEVTEAIRSGIVRAACRRQDDGRFGCRVRFRGFATEGCTAAVHRQRVAALRCGSGGAPPRTERHFVDCSQIGTTRVVSDPRGDTFAVDRGYPPPPADAPGADVTAIAVAVDSHELCADFTLAKPPTSRTTITFLAGPQTQTQPPKESLSATIILSPREPGVKALDHGWISAQVGTSRNQVSMDIAAPALTPALHYLFTEPFGFHLHTSEGRRGQDEAPPGPHWAPYP